MSADHLPTPCYDAKLCDDREVYEPAEDTFLLLDLLQQERDSLMQLSPIICLEIGSGSGVVSTFLYQLLRVCDIPGQPVSSGRVHAATTGDPGTPEALSTQEPKEPLILAVDINPNAAEVTQSTARLNHAPLVSPVLDDAGRALTHRLAGQTDVMLCNPPYVPTDSSETEGSGLHRAWAGGPTGTQLTHRVIRAAHSFLRPNGVLYLLAVKENDIEDLLLRGRSLGLEASVAIQRRCRNEHLYVLKYRKL